MKVTGSEIKHLVEVGKIVIDPFTEAQLNPNSYNVRLHNVMKVYKNDELYIDQENEIEEIVIPEEGYWLEPGKLYLARTVEYTETSPFKDHMGNIVALVPSIDGRSSIGRLGINIHATAGFGDIGFKGTFTLEISVIQRVLIKPDIQIGQISYDVAYGKPDMIYQGRYQGQVEATKSRLYIDNDQ